MYDINRIHELLGQTMPADDHDDTGTCVTMDPDQHEAPTNAPVPEEPVSTPARPISTPVRPIRVSGPTSIIPATAPQRQVRSLRDGHLTDAHREWARRGPDERFWTLDEAWQACERYRRESRSVPIDSEMRLMDTGSDDIRLLNQGETLRLSHHGFRSLCQRAGAPSEYLSSMPASLVTQCLNHGVLNRENGTELLVTGDRVRAVTSDRYERVWNADVFRLVMDRIQPDTWKLPPAGPLWNQQLQAELEAAGKCRMATADDCLRTSLVEPGQMIVPSGCYASDHDMFIFLVNDENRIDDGSDGGLGRGVFIRNSEVGQSSLRLTFFLYRYVCQNHIVWHASGVREIRLRHTRGVQQKTRELGRALLDYGNAGTSVESRLIQAAKRKIPGDSGENIVEWLFDRRLLSRSNAQLAFEYAKYESDLRPDVDPRSVWGIVQGITWLSQTPGFAGFTDRRTELDQAAGRLMSLVN